MLRLFRIITITITLLILISHVFRTSPVHAQSLPPLTGDALRPPAPNRIATRSTQTSVAPDHYMPSGFLAGSVAVRLVFVESDGSAEPSTENWTKEQKTQVEASIHASLNWWAERLPNAHVSFKLVPQVVSTQYEPINHTLNDEKLWASDVFAHLGFNGTSHFEQAYSADDTLRHEQQTDWATTIFVINSDNDVDGAFKDGLFAYAYVGGPFLVVTSDAGMYGASQLTQVVAHEFGHIFGALDQYESAGTPCTAESGYLSVATTNSQANHCGTHFSSIMLDPVNAYNTHAIDDSALGQVGYRDSNNNGIPDPIDTSPALQVSFGGQTSGRPIVVVHAQDQPLAVPIEHAATINSIARIEYRVNGRDWHVIVPNDGTYDSVDETVQAALPLYDGEHVVDFRAVNRVGATSPVVTKQITVNGVGAAPVYTVEVPSVVNITNVPLRIHAPDGFQVRVSETLNDPSASWTSDMEHATATVQPVDGAHGLFITLRDEHGIETPTQYNSVLLDREAPTGNASVTFDQQPELRIHASDSLSGIDAMEIQVQSGVGQWQLFTPEVALPPDVVPTQIRLRDRAGNVSAPLLVQHANSIYIPLAQNS